MPDNKQKCKSCKNRHLPPTGKKCQDKSAQSDKESTKGLRDAAVASKSLATDQENIWMLDGQQIQLQILEQLKQMSQRLDMVEDYVATTSQHRVQASASGTASGKLSTDTVFSSSIKKCSKNKKFRPTLVTSDSSSGESDSPSMEKLNSHAIQREVDKRLRDLNKSSQSPGNCSSSKLKSKRGGNVEVNVKNKVAWPHESILGGVSRQRVTYDQLTLTQWVQGFCKNNLDESCSKKISWFPTLMI